MVFICPHQSDVGPEELIAYLNSSVAKNLLEVFVSLNYTVGAVRSLPFAASDKAKLVEVVSELEDISKSDWDNHETSTEFKISPLLKFNTSELQAACEQFMNFSEREFFRMHHLEELNNQIQLKSFGLESEFDFKSDEFKISILQDGEIEWPTGAIHREQMKVSATGLIFDYDTFSLQFNLGELISQFVSYAVGCMLGRYSLDKPGLILANAGETLEDHLKKVGRSKAELTFAPDDDNIIPILSENWFEDDIVGRFHLFLRATFGEPYFRKNLSFVEEALGKDMRAYFVKDFWKDHITRYQKRPIYWLFASPKGHFKALIYVHRYTPDTLNRMLNGYVVEHIHKMSSKMDHLRHQRMTATGREEAKIQKELDHLQVALKDVQDYAAEVLQPLAVKRIALDLDDGVLVNINRFGAAIPTVTSLNDAKTRKKVKAFDWCDRTNIEE